MLKNEAVLEIKKNDRVYRFYLDNGSPLGEVYDVLYEMRSFVFQKISEAQNQAKPEEKQACQE